MGAAVTFVITIATVVAWLLQTYVLNPLGLQFLQTIVFILVIAFLVQLLEIVMKKTVPSLYQALGVFLPLITTNCAVLGVAILVIQKGYNLMEALTYGISTSIGFTLALWIFAGIREQARTHAAPTRHERGAHRAYMRRHTRNGIHGILRNKNRMIQPTEISSVFQYIRQSA